MRGPRVSEDGLDEPFLDLIDCVEVVLAEPFRRTPQPPGEVGLAGRASAASRRAEPGLGTMEGAAAGPIRLADSSSEPSAGSAQRSAREKAALLVAVR